MKDYLFRINFLVAILVMFIANVSNSQAEQNTQQVIAQFDEFSDYMDRITKEEMFSGVILIAKGDKVLFENAYGMADRSKNMSSNVDTKFNLGSIAKIFTSIAIAQLVEQGKLSFDDVIKKYIDDFPDEIANKITIHQLLTHTSGLGNIFTPAYMEQKDEVSTVDEFVTFITNQPLRFEPGTQYQYSNGGFIVLGKIIEKVSGENYFEYIRKNVLQPMGMNNTDFYNKNDNIPNLARGYVIKNAGPTQAPPPSDGQPQRMRMPQSIEERKAMREDNFSTLPLIGNPSGGAYSTVRDMLKLSNALTRSTILSKEYSDLIMSKKVDTPMGAYGYGLEILVENGYRMVGHSGGAPGISSMFRILTDEDYTVVILSNYEMVIRGPYEEIINKYIKK